MEEYNEIVKPCPFCGGDAYVCRTNHQIYIECSNTKNGNDRHLIQVSARTFEEALKRWNTRQKVR